MFHNLKKTDMKHLTFFNRHENMSQETRESILRLNMDISAYNYDQEPENELRSIENALFGLFDGYFYRETIYTTILELITRHEFDISHRLAVLFNIVKAYPEDTERIDPLELLKNS